MIKVFMIGTLGADAEKKSVDGSKFTTFRLAHNETWVDQAGAEHSNTIWVDATMNDHPKVAEFLKRGTQIYIEGYPNLRVYSSPKDKCMKAGMTIRVQRVELIGGKIDPIPKELIDADAQIHQVNKFYNVKGIKKPCQMVDKHGNTYDLDKNGWITPHSKDSNQSVGQQDNNSQADVMSETTKTGTDGKPF